MAFLDGSVVAVALPVMQRELSLSVGLAQWVIESYALMLAALVLVGGGSATAYGRSACSSLGVALFVARFRRLRLALAGRSPSIAARAVQGMGAALLVPGSLALISAAFPATRAAARSAPGRRSARSRRAIGPVDGRMAGGLTLHGRWVFFCQLPVRAWCCC